MNIKNFNGLTEKPVPYIRKFLETCSINEKISAFYFHVKIVSKNSVGLYRANHTAMLREDIILNSMWKTPAEDFNIILCSHPDFMNDYVGYTFSFFYMPVEQPLGVKYHSGFRYILSYVKDAQGHTDETKETAERLVALSDLISDNGTVVCDETRSISQKKELDSILKHTGNYDDYIDKLQSFVVNSLVDKSLLHSDEPEGFILKSREGLWQIPMNEPEIVTEQPIGRISLEFFMHLFCEYLSQNDYAEHITNSYVKSVCMIFIDFCNHIDMKSFDYYNIKAENLASPTFGYYSGTCYELIPVRKVREMCTKSPMYDNMFKILLNGLRRRRKSGTGSVLLSDKDIEAWNKCSQLITIMSVSRF